MLRRTVYSLIVQLSVATLEKLTTNTFNYMTAKTQFEQLDTELGEN